MKKAVLALIISCFLALPAVAKIDLSGTIRNDATMIFNASDSLFVNLLENKLLLQRKTADWKFYSDVRVTLYYSEQLQQTLALPEGIELIQTSLLRAFIKYYSDYGDITIGKTYINFGNSSVFNPFEMDQNLTISDFNSTKAGLIAATFDFELNDLTVGKLYISPEAVEGNASFGGTLSTNVGSFDTGVVINHLGTNQNVAGVYIKGDLELGVQASWAYHLDDHGGNNYSELTAGLDYSFFDGKLIASCMGYLNGAGSEPVPVAGSFLTNASTGVVEAFAGHYYIYANLIYAPDEFLQWSMTSLVHTRDSSSLIIPAIQSVIANGLTVSGQCIIPTGAGGDQYSRESYGDVIAFVRLEAKL